MKFILWNSKRDGHRPSSDEDGNIISDGVLGRITEDNVYLKVYAKYFDDKRPKDLKVCEAIKGVMFTLSGESGSYDVWRVE